MDGHADKLDEIIANKLALMRYINTMGLMRKGYKKKVFMEWLKYNEKEIKKIPKSEGLRLFVYYGDTKYDRYDIIFCYDLNLFFGDLLIKVINQERKHDKIPLLYCLVKLPEIPDGYKASGGIKDDKGALIEIDRWGDNLLKSEG